MSIKRRTFLKISTVYALSNFFIPSVFAARSRRGEKEKAVWVPGVGRYANTVCNGCLSGCGMRVKRIEKNAVKIEGNPDFPINNGTLCARGQAALQALYNPDRVKAPLKRTGQRGGGQWKEIDWKTAIKEVATRMQKLRKNGKPHALSLLTGRVGEGTPFLIDRFMKSFGSPNLIWCPSLANETVTRADYFMDGGESYKAYDFTNTQYLMTFGDVLMQSPGCYMHVLNSFKQMRFARPGRRVKLLSVDSRLSTTAAKADEWVPINPGTEGALALGIAHVLIKENLYNSVFVERHTFGFEDWEDESGEKHTGFKNMVLKEYSPEQVSSITGVAQETVIRLAREFAENIPAMALCSNNSYFYSNGGYNAMACYALNALAGSINASGGTCFQRKPPVTSFPLPKTDKIAGHGLSMPRIDGAGGFLFPFASHAAGNFPKAILSQRSYPIDTLMLYHCNPLFKRVDSKAYKRALDNIPFVVNFSPFMDETALYSDLILPESTFLERWESTSVASSLGKAVYAVRQPVVKPLYNTLNTGDVIMRLAKKIGKPVSSAFPWDNSENFVKERVRGIQESGKGSVVSTYSKKFWKKLLDKGGWWETDYNFNESGNKFKTPSGKFEFFSQIMRKRYEKSNIEKQEPIAWGDKMFMPHYEPPKYYGRKMKYPFLLIPFPTASLGSGGGGNQPYLQEIFGSLHGLTGETWVEVSPEQARRLHIADRDPVWIESSRGRIKALAKIFQGVLPDVVHMPLGQGHTAYGRYAKARGVSPLAIIESRFDPISGAQVLTGTRVRIYKA